MVSLVPHQVHWFRHQSGEGKSLLHDRGGGCAHGAAYGSPGDQQPERPWTTDLHLHRGYHPSGRAESAGYPPPHLGHPPRWEKWLCISYTPLKWLKATDTLAHGEGGAQW